MKQLILLLSTICHIQCIGQINAIQLKTNDANQVVVKITKDTLRLIQPITMDENKKTLFLAFITQFVHKGDTLISIFPMTPVTLISLNDTITSLQESKTKTPFITLHGNILYDFSYRSAIDTPYAESNVSQHIVQTYIHATIKNEYPLRLYFTNRYSNSTFFRNFNDVNLEFNPQEFTNKIKQQLKAQIASAISLDSLTSLKQLIDRKIKDLLQLQNWIKNPAHIQRLIEAREKLVISRKKEHFFNVTESVNLTVPDFTDSLTAKLTKVQNEYDDNKAIADSLQNEILKLQKLYSEKKEKIKVVTASIQSKFEEIRDVKVLQSHLSALGLSDSLLPKSYKLLLNLRSFKVGRSLVDYSELSVKNLSITGLQVEYNPKNYYAFATGIVDYRFRDFTVANRNAPTQYLNLLRVGKGFREGNNIILTYYTGKRQLFNSSTTLQGLQIPNYKLHGFTVEGQLKINETNFIVAEVAKSSIPYYSVQNSDGKNLLQSIWKLNDRSNEAYSVKIAAYIPSTKTKFNGFYKHFGNNFQSFSLFTSGSSQSSWSAKIDQELFKRKLFITGSVRANDFTNPFIGRGYSSTTIFKSIQANLRLRKFPVLSVGYYPSSQLTKLSDAQFQENLFYTLTASANHFYKIKDLLFQSSLVYTRFYNKATDSNFVYFNTKNFFLSQNLVIKKFTFQSNITVTTNAEYDLYTMEQNCQYSINSWLRIGAGLKYNTQSNSDKELIGYSASGLLKIPRIGEFQFNIDKGFLPGVNKDLVENNFGRLSFFKTF